MDLKSKARDQRISVGWGEPFIGFCFGVDVRSSEGCQVQWAGQDIRFSKPGGTNGAPEGQSRGEGVEVVWKKVIIQVLRLLRDRKEGKKR